MMPSASFSGGMLSVATEFQIHVFKTVSIEVLLSPNATQSHVKSLDKSIVYNYRYNYI